MATYGNLWQVVLKLLLLILLRVPGEARGSNFKFFLLILLLLKY
nr:MAG TPA: hypothetical protein [Caudoviricetes sp.]